jgi:hypothetical protein
MMGGHGDDAGTYGGRTPTAGRGRIEALGGALLAESPFYVVRDADDLITRALKGQESVVLVRGPRQIGKSSLLARGVGLVRSLGWRHATTDFQMVGGPHLADVELFSRVLTETLSQQLGFAYNFDRQWRSVFGPNMNLANFVRSLLLASDEPLVWFMDEADVMFDAKFGNEFFGLVRSWHNARATDPDGPWQRLTVVIAYATEARLFIRDLNQSPFNVGRRIPMTNFTVEQISDLNGRYGGPIQRQSDLQALHFLLAGQPYLIQVAFDHMASTETGFPAFCEIADRDDGPYGDHLRRLLSTIEPFSDVRLALRTSLDLADRASMESLERLIAAGALRREESGAVVPACDLYAQYLQARLG